jgi:hypothetical protein
LYFFRFSVLKDYSKEQFAKDVVAGIIVAIIALPLSIALALASIMAGIILILVLDISIHCGSLIPCSASSERNFPISDCRVSFSACNARLSDVNSAILCCIIFCRYS